MLSNLIGLKVFISFPLQQPGEIYMDVFALIQQLRHADII